MSANDPGERQSWRAGRFPALNDVPRGPVTVTVLLGVCLYVVKSFNMYGSPRVSSTPGGIEIGVRPNFEGLEVDAENCRRAAGAGAQFWKAGTRKKGNVTMDEGATALALLGASIWKYGDREQQLLATSRFSRIQQRWWIPGRLVSSKIAVSDYIS